MLGHGILNDDKCPLTSVSKYYPILSDFITHYEVMNKKKIKIDSVRRSVEPFRVRVSAAWNELDMMMMDEVDAKSKPWGKPDDVKSSPGRCKISSDTKSNSGCHISVWCSQGIVVLREGAQANSGC